MTTSYFRNVRPAGGAATNVLVRDGRIAALGEAAPANVACIDGEGALMLPGLIDAHAHLDKTLYGLPWYRNEVGPRLIDKIENERAVKQRLGLDPCLQASRQLVMSIADGTSHIRTHVDVDTEGGVAAIEGVMRARERYQDAIDVQIVAFPQSGLLIRPGTLALMDEALRMGAEVIGGLDPAGMDRDPKGHLDALFDLAQKHGKPIDIHLHETGELGAFSMQMTIDRVLALGMQGQVTLSHAFCLGMPDADAVRGLTEGLVKAGVHIMTTGSASRPVPHVASLLKAGVIVCTGNDGMRDTWGPYGKPDMLERTMLLGLRNNFRRDDELDLALHVTTYGNAHVLGLQDYGLGIGCHADFVLVNAETVAEAIVARPVRKLVVKGGSVVARDGHALVKAPQ